MMETFVKDAENIYVACGIRYINALFKIERELSDMSLKERLERRQILSKPIFESFLEWSKKTSSKIITNENLRQALVYVENQKDKLGQFLNDGNIPLSTNLVERAIRPFAVNKFI